MTATSSSPADRVMGAASAAYTAAWAAGSVLSVGRGYRAEPLGIRTGLSPRRDVIAGNGAALAAPWPMMALLWHALRAARRPGPSGRRARARLAVLAALFLAGSTAEPISHRIVTGRLPAADATIAVLNIVLPVVMLGSAVASLSTTGAAPPSE